MLFCTECTCIIFEKKLILSFTNVKRTCTINTIDELPRRTAQVPADYFVSKRFDIDAVLVVMDRKFFTLVLSPAHYLHPHPLLPPVK